jgi:hypothetical protein
VTVAVSEVEWGFVGETVCTNVKVTVGLLGGSVWLNDAVRRERVAVDVGELDTAVYVISSVMETDEVGVRILETVVVTVHVGAFDRVLLGVLLPAEADRSRVLVNDIDVVRDAVLCVFVLSIVAVFPVPDME